MNVKFLSFDGQNDGDRMPDIEKFKVWILLARKLGELDGLPKFHREFAQKVVDSFKENRPEKYNDKGELISDVQSNGASVE
ncbi:hypothetical protein GTO27_04700 [Candidatus Bathyarchaeota archaeon]|nr:hypothetical protein [Candidatus Bathyarchaeota archaeon]